MSDEFVFTNNAESTLAAPMGGGDGAFTVAAGEGARFPNITVGQGKKFPVLMQGGGNSEYMTATSRNGDIFSVTRTDSNSFPAGAAVKLVITSEVLEANLQKGVIRQVTEDPDGSLAAEYSGEEVYNSATKHFWKHCEGTSWKQMTT